MYMIYLEMYYLVKTVLCNLFHLMILPTAQYWLGLGSNPAGFEFQWQCRWRIWPCLVSDWLARGLSKQTQPTTRLACSNGHECYRLGNDCIQFKLSHKPGVAHLNCGG